MLHQPAGTPSYHNKRSVISGKFLADRALNTYHARGWGSSDDKEVQGCHLPDLSKLIWDTQQRSTQIALQKLQEEASCVLACGVVRVEGACDLMVDFRM
jgi:hypothetical protein